MISEELVDFIQLFANRLQKWEIETSIDYIIKHNESTLGFECFLDYLSDAEVQLTINEFEKIVKFNDLLNSNRIGALANLKKCVI
jgi:hypothetical protein